MSNLLNTVKGLMTDGMIGKLSSLIGSNASMTQSAMTRILPSLMGGIIKKGTSAGGASSLLNMIKDHNRGGSTVSNLGNLIGGGKETDGFLSAGSKLNESIFGSALSGISKTSGLSGDSSSKLMNAATPLLMGSLGKVVEDKNLDAAGLEKYLEGQKSFATGAISSAKATAGREVPTRSGGGSIMRWLIPLFLLLSAAWFFLQHKNDSAAATADKTSENVAQTASTTKATHTHADGTVHEGHSHGSEGHSHGSEGHSHGGSTTSTTAGAAGAQIAGNATGMFVDEAGNLIKDGKLLLKKGEFTVKDGEFFDASGKSVGFLKKVGQAIGDAGKAVGGAVGDAGKAVGDAGKAVGGAVGDAAESTADFFKDTFGGMFKKKASGGSVAAYSLSKIQFDKESHKITSFSKNEVMGLASALKAYPDSKIQVQVNTNDGSDDKGNEKLSKIRAEVVHDMLVTLGVSDKQISFKGAGSGAEKVAITVE